MHWKLSYEGTFRVRFFLMHVYESLMHRDKYAKRKESIARRRPVLSYNQHLYPVTNYYWYAKCS